MKKLLLILFTVNSFAQAPTIEWEKYLGGTDSEIARCVKQTSDGGYIVAGYTESNDGDVSGLHAVSIEDFWIVKLNPNGTIQWQKALGGNGDEEAYSIIETNDGGYIAAGYATYPNSGDVSGIHSFDWIEDFWIVKINNSGNIQWAKTLGGTGGEVAKDIKQTSDGGYIVIGSTMSNDDDVSGLHGTYPDAWVVKLNPTGVIEWQKTYGGTTYDYGDSIIQTSDGGYIFSGQASSTDGDLAGITPTGSVDGTMWVVKVNNLGAIQWQKKISGGGEGFSIKATTDGGCLVLGSAGPAGEFTNFSGINFGHTGIVKISPTGTILWAKSYGGTSGGIWFGNVIQSSDGNYVFTANIASGDGDVTDYNEREIWVVKIAYQTGSILWQKTLGRADTDENVGFIDQTNDNGYIVCGSASSATGFTGYHGGGADYYVVKLSSDNLSIPEFTTNNLLLFPNPASNTLKLQLSNEMTIDKVIITDMSGKDVFTSNDNTTHINTENLAKGIYFIQAFSEKNIYQSKFIKQ